MSESIAILVVDDNPTMANTLSDILDVKGFKVYSATSGEKALAVLRDNLVDILLTDVRMPDMNGVVLYRKSRQTHPKMVTLLMTAYAADDIIQQGMMEGIRTVLTKPLDIDFLISILSAYQRIFSHAH
jgi:CheY-like chemotaxis protein